jgi:hypothetical protein
MARADRFAGCVLGHAKNTIEIEEIEALVAALEHAAELQRSADR